MVLHVVAHIEGDEVEGAIVGVRLMTLQEHIVLSNEMSRDGVQAHAQDGACDQVNDGLQAPQVVDYEVHHKLNDCVQHLQSSDWLGVDHQGPKCVEEGLEEEPDHFPQGCGEEPALPICGDVHIQAVAAQVAVMIDVVLLEGGRVRQADREVGKHSEPAVQARLLVAEGHVVGDVVDS